MALGFTEIRGSRSEVGQYRRRCYQITLDTDYPTAGWAINPQNVGLDSWFGGSFLGLAPTTGVTPLTTSYVFQLDTLNQKLQVFATGSADGAGLSEAASGLDALAGRNVIFEFLGY